MNSAERAVDRARVLLARAGIDAESVADEALALSAIPAPTFDEGTRREEVARRLGTGMVDGAGNLLVRLGPDGPAPIVVAAHLDTVFPAGTDVACSREGDALHGPGIGDNALAVAATMGMARALMTGPRPGVPLVLAFTVGEEGLGDLVGARAVCASLRPVAFIAVEGHFLDRLSLRGVGSVRLEARFATDGGHSWGDRGAPSAVHAAARAAAEIAALSPGGEAAVSVGVIEGGTSVNTIAAHARLLVDVRAVAPARLELLESQVRGAVATAAAAEGAAVVVTEIGRRPAGATPDDHPLAVALREVRAAVGLPAADPAAVSTDANAAFGAGIPAAAIGVSRGGGMHTLGEWVGLGPLQDGLVALTATAVALGLIPGDEFLGPWAASGAVPH